MDCLTISRGIKVDDLIGEDYTFQEFEEHNKDGARCICQQCNYALGYNKRGSEIKERLNNLQK
jgi:hypothetical protein